MNIDNIKYDIVILTHAPKEDLLTTIKRIGEQSIKPQKLVLYNTDEKLFFKYIDRQLFSSTISKIDFKVEVIHIDKEAFDHGKARNDARKLCESDYILYLTDDAIPYDSYLAENLISAFSKYGEKVAVSYARQIAKENASLKEKYVREFNYPDYDIIKEKDKEIELGIKNYFCSNVCAMYDVDIFDKLGRFEEDIILNEDTFYVYNAIQNGYKIVYSAEAKVYHSHNLSYFEQFCRNFDIGVSQSEKKEIFDKIPSKKEGIKLLKYVELRLLKEFHIITAIDFVIECVFRFLGFEYGKKYVALTIDDCIKFATNKNYFMKKK